MKNFPVFLFIVISFLLINSTYSFHGISFKYSDSTNYELNGEIQSKKGKTITVSITSSTALPETGTKGVLSKYFEEEILGFSTHGYIDIGEVEVIGITESEVTFSLLKELSNIKINGKKENHFKKGKIVRFIW